MKEPTIVFLHWGPTPYLYYVVKQARHWNPRADIIVLSDIPRPELERHATVVPFERHDRGAKEFAGIYQHHSENSFAYEIFNFQRWFILRDYAATHGLRQIVHLDSDELTYSCYASEFSRLGSFDVGVVGYQGPQSMLIAEPAFIGALCDRITELFTVESSNLATMYAEWKTVTDFTAVQDMHAIHTLLARGAFKQLDLSAIRDNAVYDGAIHEAEGYDFANGQKQFSWCDGQPWGRHVETNSLVRFCALHCQGAAKNRILEHFKARDFSYYYDRLKIRMRRGA